MDGSCSLQWILKMPGVFAVNYTRAISPLVTVT